MPEGTGSTDRREIVADLGIVHRRSMKWVWWLLAVAALVVLFWGLFLFAGDDHDDAWLDGTTSRAHA